MSTNPKPEPVVFEGWAEKGELSGQLCIAGALSLHDWFPKPGEIITHGASPIRVRVTVEPIEEG